MSWGRHCKDQGSMWLPSGLSRTEGANVLGTESALSLDEAVSYFRAFVWDLWSARSSSHHTDGLTECTSKASPLPCAAASLITPKGTEQQQPSQVFGI